MMMIHERWHSQIIVVFHNTKNSSQIKLSNCTEYNLHLTNSVTQNIQIIIRENYINVASLRCLEVIQNAVEFAC